VGESLARWAEAAGAELVAVAGRSPDRPSWPGGPPRTDLPELATAGQDLLLVAVSDAALPEVAAVLSRRPQASVALHTAGGLDAAVLSHLRRGGTAVGSLHPLKAFPSALPDPVEARRVFFAVDGDPEALALARRLAEAWGGVPGEVPPEARTLYHFAATLAAGGVVTLLAAAADLAARLGLPDAVAAGYLELSRGAVAAASEALERGEPLSAAITGPVARGDQATVARQMEALRRLAPEKVPLAEEIARETVRRRKRW
jgi:predicted short-subunit dehydrogenase-like oxidoreductase (DUF2520 family)